MILVEIVQLVVNVDGTFNFSFNVLECCWALLLPIDDLVAVVVFISFRLINCTLLVISVV